MVGMLIAGLSVQPAVAADPSDSAEATTFSVLGDLGVPVGDEVSLSDLEGLNISETDLNAVGVEIADDESLAFDGRTELTTPDSSVVAPMAAYDVIATWYSQDNKLVYLREAPYIKITTTHNLTTAAVKRVTKSATSILAAGSGTNWSYYLMANQVTCYPWGCYVTASANVRVLVDYRAVTGGTYGVVTAYCEGYSGACPDFVKNALNV